MRQLIVVDEDEGKPVGVMTRYVILKELEREEEKAAAAQGTPRTNSNEEMGFEQEQETPIGDSVIS